MTSISENYRFHSYADRLASDNGAMALAVAITGTLLAVSVFYSPLPLVTLIVVPASVYFISRPYELLLTMVFLIPFNFVFTVGSIPVAVELLKVFAWIPLFFYFRNNPELKFRSSRFNKYFAVAAALLALSVCRSHDLPYTVKECVRFGSNLGLCYLAINLIDTREKITQVFKVLIASTFLVACYGFYQFAIQDYGALFWIVNPRVETSLAHYRDSFWEWRNRLISVMTSEMEIAHYFNLCIPVGVYLWVTEGRQRLTSKWLLSVLVMLAALVLTFTMGAWLALAATAVLFVLLLDKKRRWKLVLAGVLVLLLVLWLAIYGPLQSYVEAKFSGYGEGSFAWDAMTRLDMWGFALHTWWSHPLFGVGVGNYELLAGNADWILGPAASQGSSPHETFLYLLVLFGAVGTFAVLWIVLNTIWSNIRMIKDAEYGPMFLALAFALVAVLIGGFSDDSGFFGPHAGYLMWLFVGVSESVRNCVLKKTAAVEGVSR